jgi:O-antigen/teichoic acid export membrane protein
MSEPVPGEPTPRARRDASLLAAGSLVGGVLAYVFFALVTRTLGAGPAAPVAVLWAWWGFAGAAFTFPVQHWIARTAAQPAGEAAVRRGLPHVAVAVCGASLVAGGVAWVARDRLFGPDGDWFPVLVVAVGVGSGLLGVVRGTLSGRHRFAAVAAGLVAENGIRCLAAAVLAAAGVGDPVVFGLALVAGYAAAALWPAALVPRRAGAGGGGTPLLFLSGASAGQLLAQATLTGGPVLLAAVGGASAEVTALFAGLALFRAPYTLALGLVSALTGRLTRLVEAGHRDRLRRIRLFSVAATLGAGVLAALVGGWLGPPVMELVFGEGVRLDALESGVVAVGSVLALANLVLTVGLLARGRSTAAARTWLVAVPFGLPAYLLVDGPELLRTCWAFAVVEAVAWVGFTWWEARSDRLVGGQEHR